jgi:hypothetical protein
MPSAAAYLSWTLGFGAWLGVLGALAYHTVYAPATEHSSFVRAVLLTSPILGSILFGAAFLSLRMCALTLVNTVTHMFRLDVLTSLIAALVLGGIVLGVWVHLEDMAHLKTPAERADASPAPSSASSTTSSQDTEDRHEEGGLLADDELDTSGGGSSGGSSSMGSAEDTASETVHTSDQFDAISETE